MAFCDRIMKKSNSTTILQFSKMTKIERQKFIAKAQSNYARTLSRSLHQPLKITRLKAQQSFQQIFRNKTDSKNHIFQNIILFPSYKVVGALGIKFPNHVKPRFFISCSFHQINAVKDSLLKL